MSKCSFTNGSCQHTQEGRRACSLMFLCLCNAPQPETTPLVLYFQAMKPPLKKGSCSSRPKIIRDTFKVGTERKRRGDPSHTHQHASLPTVHTCSAEIFSSKHFIQNGGGGVKVMIKGCVCEHMTTHSHKRVAVLVFIGGSLGGGAAIVERINNQL